MPSLLRRKGNIIGFDIECKMSKLIRFMDDDRKGRWANVRMGNGDPCWIGIAQTGILVKKSKIGLFGTKLYEEKNIDKAARTSHALFEKYPDTLTPAEMLNPVLQAITNAVLHCKNLEEVSRVLNEADRQSEYNFKIAEVQTPDSFKNNLLAFANLLRKDIGFPESNDIEGAAVIVLTHIISSAQGKMGILPVKGNIRRSDAIISATFSCFIGSPIILYLRNEGVELSINDVLARAEMALFQFLNDDVAASTICEGMEQYKKPINTIPTRNNIKEYSDTVNHAVFLYVMSGDEQMLETFKVLFQTLLKAHENNF